MMVYLSTILMTVITTIVGGVAGTFLGCIIERHKKDKAGKSFAVNKNRADLFEHYTKILEQGYTTPHEIEIWEPLYEYYVECGGNGVVHRLHDEITDLPIKVIKEG